MTFEEFYGKDYDRLLDAKKKLETMVEQIKSDGITEEDLQPIVYYCSRIKNPSCILLTARNNRKIQLTLLVK